MKKRIISYITLICITISLCCTAVVAFGIVPELEEQVVVTAFENYSATEDTLTAENISSMNTTTHIEVT